jgi:hypothetical protein
MNTFSNLSNVNNSINTEVKTSSNTIKKGVMAGAMVLGLILPSNQMYADKSYSTSNIRLLLQADGSFSTNGGYSNIHKHNYTERYQAIAKSEWFLNAYKNRSLGEIVGIDK